MIRQGMNLTKEQRGETSNPEKQDEKSEVKDGKKPDAKDEKTIQVSLQAYMN
jgi:transcription initiation factor TFIIE subunit alpha